MNIGLIQLRAQTGDVTRNTTRHLRALEQIEHLSPELVVFPELSLTNYDALYASRAAVTLECAPLARVRDYSRASGVAVAVGLPVHRERGLPWIAQVVCHHDTLTLVGKHHLHDDELPYFSPHPGDATVLDMTCQVGMAICYELTISSHAQALVQMGAQVYVASVAKTRPGVRSAQEILRRRAVAHNIPMLMVNGVGYYEGSPAGGCTQVINADGEILATLNEVDEGALVFDTETQAVEVVRFDCL